MCAEVVLTLRESGYLIRYFDVNDKLSTDSFPSEIEHASAILAVNYFGFPCDLTPFSSVAKSSECVVIEDNAHGWLSSDEFGQPLGSRTGVGFTSFRKSIRVSDGAILHRSDLFSRGVNPLPPSNTALPLGFRMRQLCSTVEEVSRVPLMNIARSSLRLARRLTGNASAPVAVTPEHQEIAGIHQSSLKKLLLTDVVYERARRRHLFLECLALSKLFDAEPVFTSLPQNAVPLGFPFYGDLRIAQTFARKVFRMGLEVFRWPVLSPDIASQALPYHYRDLWLVNFLR
jgi:hypothetical protein